MKDAAPDIRFLSRGETLDDAAPTGVSLHCHTMHSREMLDFVPYYFQRIPVASYFWDRAQRRRKRLYDSVPDFTGGYWQPPLSGGNVVESETSRIARLGLNAIVSITDHDSIDACLDLNDTGGTPDVPISMEWTVPFEDAFFHVGVNNLPAERARDIVCLLLDYTNAPGEPSKERLTDLLVMLGEMPGVLVVLNHPIWDIEMIGQEAHERALGQFLIAYSRLIHAVEINGFRTWSENETAICLAGDIGLPVVSGGDRHCCQPNTMINITGAQSFDEFVYEIRSQRFSRIAVLPEYHLPLPSRQLASIAQILADYPEFSAGRRLWSDRVFLDGKDGRGLISLTEQWDGTRPLWTHFALAAVRLLAHPAMRQFIGLAVGDKDIGRTESKAKTGRHPATISPIVPKRLWPEST